MGRAVQLHLRPVIGMGARVELGGKVGDVVVGIAKHGLDAGGEELLTRADVPVPHTIARALQGQLPERFARMQGGFGFLAVGDVEQHAHAQETMLVGRHRAGPVADPLDAPVRQHDTELRIQTDHARHDRLAVPLQHDPVFGMKVPREQRGIAHQVFGLEAVELTDAGTEKAVLALAVVPHKHREHSTRHLGSDQPQLLLAVAQCLLVAHAIGDVLHRALVIQQHARRIAHAVRVLADPHTFACLVAVDLRDEAAHVAVALQLCLELPASHRVNVPLVGDVVHRIPQFRLGCITIEPHQRLVGAQHLPLGRAAVGPDGQEIEEGRKIPVGRRWRQCHATDCVATPSFQGVQRPRKWRHRYSCSLPPAFKDTLCKSPASWPCATVRPPGTATRASRATPTSNSTITVASKRPNWPTPCATNRSPPATPATCCAPWRPRRRSPARATRP
ncbi:hypothetical protein FQZ97_692090 [compost metagenome]